MLFYLQNNEISEAGMKFADALNLSRGVTAIIGSGGKTTLLLHLADELSKRGSVIVTTSTHIYPPMNMPVVEEIHAFEGCICVGTPCENGKLTAPKQSFEELAALADYVLVEADGSKHLPLKAHLSYEPVIPRNAAQVICVVGASGLNHPIEQTVHRFERFFELTGEKVATPRAVALALDEENLADRYVINQIDANETAARELAQLLRKPSILASMQRGEMLCLY